MNIARKTIIITNGELPNPNKARRHIQPGDRIISANGGSRHALAMGLTPDVVVGDMDSLDAELRAELEASGVRFEIHPVNKDETDLELALRLAIADGATTIDILAVWGGRLDQSMANILLLTRPEWDTARVRIISEDETAQVIKGGQEMVIRGNIGDTLSLIPLSATANGTTLTGVKWPLDNATLRLGSTLGVSNLLVEPSARLKIKKGLLLVVHQSVTGEAI